MLVAKRGRKEHETASSEEVGPSTEQGISRKSACAGITLETSWAAVRPSEEERNTLYLRGKMGISRRRQSEEMSLQEAEWNVTTSIRADGSSRFSLSKEMKRMKNPREKKVLLY